MSNRYKGGVISATGPTVSSTVASGIWTNQSVVQLTGAGTWPRVPGAPTIGTATAGNASASVTFSAPADTGSAAITSYTVTSTPGSFSNTGAASPITVTGLTNNTAYTFVALATNGAGTGPASAASNSVTPTAPPAFIFAYYSGSQNLSGTSGVYLNGQVIYPFGQVGTVSGGKLFSAISISSTGALLTQDAFSLSPLYSSTTAQLSVGQRSYFDGTYIYFGERINGGGEAYFSRRRPTSATSQFRRRTQLSFDTSSFAYTWSVIADASLNSYYVGTLSTGNCCGSTNYAILYKFDSGGTNQFMAKRWGNNNSTSANAGGNVFKDVTLDSSSQPVVAGSIEQTTNRAYGVIIKYDTNGSLQWQTRLVYSSGNMQFNTMARDSSYNYYVGGWTYGNGSGVIAKFNDSGTLQWQRIIAVTGYSIIIYKTRVDTSGNVFYLGSTNAANQPCYLFKYDSSGTLQWQRKIEATFSLASGNCDFAIDEIDASLVINFGTGGASGLTTNSMMMIIKYPTTGSITGSYSVGSSTVTIAAGDATDSAGSYTSSEAGSSVGSGASSINFDSTFTNTTVSYSSALTNL